MPLPRSSRVVLPPPRLLVWSVMAHTCPTRIKTWRGSLISGSRSAILGATRHFRHRICPSRVFVVMRRSKDAALFPARFYREPAGPPPPSLRRSSQWGECATAIQLISCLLSNFPCSPLGSRKPRLVDRRESRCSPIQGQARAGQGKPGGCSEKQRQNGRPNHRHACAQPEAGPSVQKTKDPITGRTWPG